MPDKDKKEKDKTVSSFKTTGCFDHSAKCKKVKDLFWVIFLIFMVGVFIKETCLPDIFNISQKIETFSNNLEVLSQEKNNLSTLTKDIQELRGALDIIKTEIKGIKESMQKVEMKKNDHVSPVQPVISSEKKHKSFQLFLSVLQERIPFDKAFEHIKDFGLSPACNEKVEELRVIYVDNLKWSVILDNFHSLYASANMSLKEGEKTPKGIVEKMKKYFMDNVYISFNGVNVFASQQNILKRMKKSIEEKNIEQTIGYVNHLDPSLGFEAWLKNAHVFIAVKSKLKELSKLKEVFA